MSYFEECLSLGQWLSEADKRALYSYLLSEKKEIYKDSARRIIAKNEFTTTMANGEIIYLIANGKISYRARGMNEKKFTRNLREFNLPRSEFQLMEFLPKYFAQCEVDVISNYPIAGANSQDERSYSYNAYPFFDLNYYSEGKGRLIGFFKKRKIDDSQILKKLMAS